MFVYDHYKDRTFLVSVKEGGNPQRALNVGEFGSSAIMVLVMFLLITNLLPETFTLSGNVYTSLGVFWASTIGLVAGLGAFALGLF